MTYEEAILRIEERKKLIKIMAKRKNWAIIDMPLSNINPMDLRGIPNIQPMGEE